ncbi:MAG: hypothetical protein FWD68_21925, partial [Alphaproteobacteria bacterium]|nr:hypothetical protein [Alphaproteobacteria bacterium]
KMSGGAASRSKVSRSSLTIIDSQFASEFEKSRGTEHGTCRSFPPAIGVKRAEPRQRAALSQAQFLQRGKRQMLTSKGDESTGRMQGMPACAILPG